MYDDLDDLAMPDDLTVAFHEAGHAVAALKVGGRVMAVSIVANEAELGGTDFTVPRNDPELGAAVSCAGAVSEARLVESSRWFDFLSDGDRELIDDYATAAGCRTVGECWCFRQRAALRAGELLDAHWPAVVDLAGHLLLKGSIQGSAVRHAAAGRVVGGKVDVLVEGRADA